MIEEGKNDDIVVNKFTEEEARSFRNKIFRRSSLDPSLPIIVYIDSYGGNVDALNNMIATMHQVPNPIVTACIGKAMSCGAILLAAGDHRYCADGSRILVHEVTAGSINPINEMEADVREARRLNNQMMNFLAKRCNHTYKEIKQMMHDNDARDITLTAKQALSFGIIDHIGLPLIRPLIMYTITTVPEHKYEKYTTTTLSDALAGMGIDNKKSRKKKTLRKKKTSKKVRNRSKK